MVTISSLLPGTLSNPEFISFYAPIGSLAEDDPYLKEGAHIEHLVSGWNQIGYVPLLSTISGVIRAVLGLFHLLINFSNGCVDEKQQELYLEECLFGLKHIYRGLLEAIPFLGNAIVFHLDSMKNELLECEMKKVSADELSNRALLFLDNRLEASIPAMDFAAEILSIQWPVNEIAQALLFKSWHNYQTLFFQSDHLWLPVDA